MSKLAFSCKGKYPDFSKGYTLYNDRSRKTKPVDKRTYCNIIRDYCKYLSEKLERDGMVDFPKGIGTLFVTMFRRKPQYIGKQFVGFGKMDWKRKAYDGSSSAFGIVFLPSRRYTANLRSFGFVANRRLFQRLKQEYDEGTCSWKPIDFNEKMI